MKNNKPNRDEVDTIVDAMDAMDCMDEKLTQILEWARLHDLIDTRTYKLIKEYRDAASTKWIDLTEHYEKINNNA